MSATPVRRVFRVLVGVLRHGDGPGCLSEEHGFRALLAAIVAMGAVVDGGSSEEQLAQLETDCIRAEGTGRVARRVGRCVLEVSPVHPTSDRRSRFETPVRFKARMGAGRCGWLRNTPSTTSRPNKVRSASSGAAAAQA